MLAKLENYIPERWSWILHHDGFRRYAANTSWMFVGQAFSLLVAFFVGTYIARYLGPADFGLLNYTFSFVTVLSFLAGFGIESVLKRDLLNNPKEQRALLGTAVWLKLGLGIISIVIVNIVAAIVGGGPTLQRLILVFSISYLFFGYAVIGTYYQTQVMARKAVVAQIIATTMSAILKIVLIVLHQNVIWIAAAYVVDSMVVACGLVFMYQQSVRKFFDWKFDFAWARHLLIQSLPLSLTYIMIIVYSKADQVLLKHMVNDTEVGLYAVAVKVSEVLLVVATVVCASLFPAIINAKNADAKVYRQRLKHLYGVLFGLAVVLSVLLYFTAGPLVEFLFGERFRHAVPLVQVYVWSTVPMFVISVMSQHLIAENLLRVYLYVSGIGALTNVALNLWLIPLHGGMGAAAATLISYSLIPVSLVCFTASRRSLREVFAGVS